MISHQVTKHFRKRPRRLESVGGMPSRVVPLTPQQMDSVDETPPRVVPLQHMESVGEMPSRVVPLQQPPLTPEQRRGVYAPTAIVEDGEQSSIADAVPEPVSSSLPDRLRRATTTGAFRSAVQVLKAPARTTTRPRLTEAEDARVLRRGQFSLRSPPTRQPDAPEP